jgi:hypothetical protein
MTGSVASAMGTGTVVSKQEKMRRRFQIGDATIVLAASILVVIGLWGIFGLFTGFSVETVVVYQSDIAQGIRGFIYWADPLRKFLSLFYHLSYILGSSVGDRGSYVPYQLVYGSLWVLRSLLTYLIVMRLMPNYPALAFFAGLFAALHAADNGLNFVGQLHQFGFVFLMLLSFLFMLLALDSSSRVTTIAWAMGSAFSGYLSLWTYESPLPVMLLFPIAAGLLRRDVPFGRLSLVSIIYLIPILIFVGENAQRYLTSSGGGANTYQASVSRHDFSIGALASDLWLHLANSVVPWNWPHAYISWRRIPEYMIAFVPVLTAIVLLAPIAVSKEQGSSQAFSWSPRLLLFAFISFAMLCASYLVVLIFAENRQLFRTEFLPSFASSCLLSAGLYAALGLVRGRALRNVIAISVLVVVGSFSTFAGVNSGLLWQAHWERHRHLISSIISNAPGVKDGTLVILRNVDPKNDPFGYNMWFDVGLRLAYPDTKVAGIYLLADNRPTPWMNIDVENGEPHLLSNGFPTLFHETPHPGISHVIAFDYDPTNGEANPVRAGAIKVGDDEVSAALSDFCVAIRSLKPDPVAVRRYWPIAAANRVTCATGADN